MTETRRPTVQGPGFYLHLELGVTWPTRTDSKTHLINYKSKALRQREPRVPRQLPPPNTNYLADYGHPLQNQYNHQPQGDHYLRNAQPAPADYFHQPNLSQRSTSSQRDHAAVLRNLASLQSGRQQPQLSLSYQPDHAATLTNLASLQPAGHNPQFAGDRASRSHSRASHDRGRSAPPPLNENPWDAEPEPMGATALPRRTTATSSFYKALPPAPAQSGNGREAGPVDDHARGNDRDMQSLATALMTVDNGFEDQWWYQGDRLVNIAGELFTPALLQEMEARGLHGGLTFSEGDRLHDLPREVVTVNSSSSSMVDIVSPLTEFPSPVSSMRGLRRSMTTRSDELHM